MHKLLWLIPLSLVALAIWLPSLIPAAALGIIGWAALSLAGTAAVAFLVMWLLAGSMAS